MDVGMAAAAAVYPLGWLDAAMVHGGGKGGCLVIHDVVCLGAVCMWFVRLVLYL
jgi:hypothetical protein